MEVQYIRIKLASILEVWITNHLLSWYRGEVRSYQSNAEVIGSAGNSWRRTKPENWPAGVEHRNVRSSSRRRKWLPRWREGLKNLKNNKNCSWGLIRKTSLPGNTWGNRRTSHTFVINPAFLSTYFDRKCHWMTNLSKQPSARIPIYR